MTNNELLETAHSLRRNGKQKEAIRLYDNLLIQQPNNDEYLFGKALALIDLDPIQAMKLFKRVIDIDPNVIPAYGNIIMAARKAQRFEEAIEIFNDLVKKFPKNFELIHQRAILLGNSGNNLKALLDCYCVIENTELKDNPELFLKHSISNDIAFGKIQLRNNTLNKSLPDLSIYNKYENTILKEYQYKLPARQFGDENFYLEFGKYLGSTINEIINKDPSYLTWCILNLDNFCVSEEIIDLIRTKGVSVAECENVNIAKLYLLELGKQKTYIQINDIDDPE